MGIDILRGSSQTVMSTSQLQSLIFLIKAERIQVFVLANQSEMHLTGGDGTFWSGRQANKESA
jgi:hypothetical protein